MASAGSDVRRARRLAALVCLVEAVVLAGFGGFYLVELASGEGTDPMRVLTAGILILLFAAGVGLLGRLWLGGSWWPATPTLVWHVLLVPVVVALFQSGQVVVGVLLALAVVTAVGATLAARPGQG